MLLQVLILFLEVNRLISGNVTYVPIPLTTQPQLTIFPAPTSTPTPPPKPYFPFCYTLNATKLTNPCVRLCVSRSINITTNLTLLKGEPILIPGPSNVIITGQCPVIIPGGLANSKISLKWTKSSNIWHQLTFSFLLNQSPHSGRYGALDTWYLDSVSYLYHNVSNYSYIVHLNETETISAQIRQAYTCSNNLTLELTQEPNKLSNGTGTNITLSSYTVQPFALNLTGNNFKYFNDCVPSGIPGIVVVLMGSILAGFVITLLLLYLICRFRIKR